MEAGLVAASADDPAADTNDGTRGYAIREEALELVRSYGTADWEDQLLLFRQKFGQLKDRLSKDRQFKMVPVTLPNGQVINLSPGPHNEIQKAIIEEFLPRFSKGAELLYVGDTSKKELYIAVERLRELGIEQPSRDTKLPDVLAYESDRDWVFVIEAVYSSNPIDQMRHLDLRRLTENTTAKGPVFVSAFLNRTGFRRFSAGISWETEVWIVDEPDHMVHFDGERFLGPFVASDGLPMDD